MSGSRRRNATTSTCLAGHVYPAQAGFSIIYELPCTKWQFRRPGENVNIRRPFFDRPDTKVTTAIAARKPSLADDARPSRRRMTGQDGFALPTQLSQLSPDRTALQDCTRCEGCTLPAGKEKWLSQRANDSAADISVNRVPDSFPRACHEIGHAYLSDDAPTLIRLRCPSFGVACLQRSTMVS